MTFLSARLTARTPRPAGRPAAPTPRAGAAASPPQDPEVEQLREMIEQLLARHPEFRATAARFPRAVRALFVGGMRAEHRRLAAIDRVATQLSGPGVARLVHAAKADPEGSAEQLALAAVGGAEAAPALHATAQRLEDAATVAAIMAVYQPARRPDAQAPLAAAPSGTIERVLARTLERHPEFRATAAAHPRAVRALIAEGSHAEHRRLAAIDAVAAQLRGPGMAALVQAAKADPNGSAGQLAIAAVQTMPQPNADATSGAARRR